LLPARWVTDEEITALHRRYETLVFERFATGRPLAGIVDVDAGY